MKSQLQKDYKQIHARLKPKVNLAMKRLYVIAFNFYAWFWIFREVFIINSTNWENYVLWFFTTAGMYYFVLDNNDVFFKSKRQENSTK